MCWNVCLPGALPKLAPISTGLGEIFYYNVNYRADAKNKPPTELEQLIELSEIQEYVIKPLLRTVPGIAEINESGGYEKQFVIQPKPDALAEVGMTFSELADLVAQNVENAGGGIISRGSRATHHPRRQSREQRGGHRQPAAQIRRGRQAASRQRRGRSKDRNEIPHRRGHAQRP